MTIRPSLRSLVRRPAVPALAVAMLGLGLAAATSMFRLADHVLLTPIPGVTAPEQLYRVLRSATRGWQSNQSYPDFADLRANARTLDGLACERLLPVRWESAEHRIVQAALASPGYFEVLGVRARRGRLFSGGDESQPVAVVSQAFFQASTLDVGAPVVLNGTAFTVVGVTAGFAGVLAAERVDVWIPVSFFRTAMTRNREVPWLESRTAGWLTVYARLRQGIRREAAEEELNAIAGTPDRRFLLAAHPDRSPSSRREIAELLALLALGAGVLLAVVCGNVAILWTLRAESRQKDLTIRRALGATAGRLLRESLGEAAWVSACGALAALVVAPYLVALVSPALRITDAPPPWDRSSIALLLVLAAGSVFIPALGSAVRPALRTTTFWAAAQTGLTIGVVFAALSLSLSLWRIARLDPGYQPEQIAVATVDLGLAGFDETAGPLAQQRLLEAARSLPGVRSVALAKSSPSVDWSDRLPVTAGGDSLECDRNIVSPGFFTTLGIPLLAGREFNPSDRRGRPGVAIVSRSLADRLFPHQDPIGRVLKAPEPLSIIGVAGDIRYRSMLREPQPLLYVPESQNYDSIIRVFAATSGNPADFVLALRKALEREAPPLAVETMQGQIARGLWRERTAAALSACLAIASLLLAALGLYAVLERSVVRRIREIGIRMAIGASETAVWGVELCRALRIWSLGLVPGLLLMAMGRRWVDPLLFGNLPYAMWVIAPLIAAAVAVAAALAPARRAGRVDPAEALRSL